MGSSSSDSDSSDSGHGHGHGGHHGYPGMHGAPGGYGGGYYVPGSHSGEHKKKKDKKHKKDKKDKKHKDGHKEGHSGSSSHGIGIPGVALPHGIPGTPGISGFPGAPAAPHGYPAPGAHAPGGHAQQYYAGAPPQGAYPPPSAHGAPAPYGAPSPYGAPAHGSPAPYGAPAHGSPAPYGAPGYGGHDRSIPTPGAPGIPGAVPGGHGVPGVVPGAPGVPPAHPGGPPPPSGFRIPLSVGQPFPPHPQGGTPVASDADGSPLFVGSAILGASVHPCKIGPHLHPPVRVPYGGAEYEHNGRYDLLPFDPNTMEWVWTEKGRIPPGKRPIEGGYEEHGGKLYHALAKIHNLQVPGKCGEHMQEAKFAFGGAEIGEREYFILCWRH